MACVFPQHTGNEEKRTSVPGPRQQSRRQRRIVALQSDTNRRKGKQHKYIYIYRVKRSFVPGQKKNLKKNFLLIQRMFVCVFAPQKACDRSWKPVWAVVRAQTLCLYKEKRESVPNISVDVSIIYIFFS